MNWNTAIRLISIRVMMTSSNGNIFRVTGLLCQWRGALMFSLICAWINGWVNNRESGDLIRHRAHYYVIVMVAHRCLRSHNAPCKFLLWHYLVCFDTLRRQNLQAMFQSGGGERCIVENLCVGLGGPVQQCVCDIMIIFTIYKQNMNGNMYTARQLCGFTITKRRVCCV